MMDKMLDLLKNYFKNRTLAFYFSLAVAFLTLITGIIYAAIILPLDYRASIFPVIMLIIGALLVPIFALFRMTRIGLGCMSLLTFFAFVLYLMSIYEYPIEQAMGVSDVWEIKGIVSIIVIAVLMFIFFVASNVLAYIKQEKLVLEGE